MIVEKAPRLAYFREILVGDLKKLRAVSNDADSGGGARDLRISPQSEFEGFMQRFFGPTNNPRIRQATVYWRDAPNDPPKSHLCELFVPTDARPTELRISKIYLLGAWRVNEDAYYAAHERNIRQFFLLTLDTDDRVWARTFSEEFLPQTTALFRDAVIDRIKKTRGNKAVCGGLDFETGLLIPND